jgi:hypothetical protein
MSQEFNQWVETFRRANNGYLPSPLEVYEHLQKNPDLLEPKPQTENQPESEQMQDRKGVEVDKLKPSKWKGVPPEGIFNDDYTDDFYKGSVPKMPNHPPMPPHKIESKEYRPMYESDCNSAEDLSVVIRNLVVILILGLVVMGLIKNL